MKRPVEFWASAVGGLVILDVWCDRNETSGDTFSEVVRLVFRTDTKAGKIAFVCAWSGLTGWFIPHIIREVERSLS